MAKASGKTIPISPFRDLVIDLMHFSMKVPAITLERRMNLAPLVAARQKTTPRLMWTVLFTKALAIVAARQPLLRRCYMSFPWPRFYEHPKNIVSINVGRKVGDEDVVVQALIRSPENRSLVELDALIRRYMERPVEEFSTYRRVTRVSRLPGFIRRWLMWSTLNWIGRRRCHNFGTMGITSVAEQGAGILHLIPLSTATLHYGLFDDKGCLDMRLAFDHRVMDGAPAAAALASVEEVLLGEVLDEVRTLPTESSFPANAQRAA